MSRLSIEKFCTGEAGSLTTAQGVGRVGCYSSAWPAHMAPFYCGSFDICVLILKVTEIWPLIGVKTLQPLSSCPPTTTTVTSQMKGLVSMAAEDFQMVASFLSWAVTWFPDALSCPFTSSHALRNHRMRTCGANACQVLFMPEQRKLHVPPIVVSQPILLFCFRCLDHMVHYTALVKILEENNRLQKLCLPRKSY